MSVNKGLRSLVVWLFTLLILFIVGYEIYINFIDTDITFNTIFSKIIYIALLITFITIYAIIKGKFSKKKIKKKLSLTYRYLLLIVTTFFLKIVAVTINVVDVNVIYILICSIIGVISAIAIKKIIYNVSKSDMLSVIGLFMFALLPNISTNSIEYLNSILVNLMILSAILVFQKVLDELKQIGIKNKKYILWSVAMAFCISFSIILGVHYVIYILLGIGMLCITANLDKTHIEFPNKVINSIRQKNKEVLYKIERIYINKQFIVVGVVLISTIIFNFGLNYIVSEIDNNFVNEVCMTNNGISSVINGQDINSVINNLTSGLKDIFAKSKGYYLILASYILVLEILTIILRRRYDTKSTMLKMVFMTITIFGALFKYNIDIYYLVYTTLFILIAITNTSNLYLNRDERVKLLNS